MSNDYDLTSGQIGMVKELVGRVRKRSAVTVCADSNETDCNEAEMRTGP
ncbi:hypothetical protein ACHAWF_001488 [Thalassiosira exigua]